VQFFLLEGLQTRQTNFDRHEDQGNSEVIFKGVRKNPQFNLLQKAHVRYGALFQRISLLDGRKIVLPKTASIYIGNR
jgi:hypothetical protein